MEREETKSEIQQKIQKIKELQIQKTEYAKKIKTLLESVNPASPRRNTQAMQKQLQICETNMKSLDLKINRLYSEIEKLAKNADSEK